MPLPCALARAFPKLLVTLLLAAFASGCAPRRRSEPSADPEPASKKSSELETPRDLSAQTSSLDSRDTESETLAIDSPDACNAAIERVLQTAALPGTPALDENRSMVLLYAKAEPVVFVKKPDTDPTSSPEAVSYRAMLERTDSPWSNLRRLWGIFSARPDLGRSVLLRDGYLYAEKPLLAFALVDLVSAQTLFSEERIWIQRGERTLVAERTKKGHYEFVDGPERGQKVKLLLFDRIGTGTPPAPLHRDFRALRLRLGFDRVKLRHVTERAIVADLRYGPVWATTLLDSDGAHLDLRCELAEEDHRSVIRAVRTEQARKERMLEPLRTSMVEQVEHGLPFDEPRTEYGQQDGRLRREWLRAYLSGKSSFEFQDDRYYVFNSLGQPLIPQVCVDYLFDTFERAGGTRFRPRGEVRERVLGKMDFGTLSDETLRRATSFIDYAKTRPESFDVDVLSESDRVPFKHGDKLSRFLVDQADRFKSGDVVMIRGYAPWDRHERLMHFHSFFVYETDPVSGQPIVLAGNPGRPLLQTWQFEAFRTPDRSIWYRIRPHADWLETVVLPSAEPPKLPPPLASDSLR